MADAIEQLGAEKKRVRPQLYKAVAFGFAGGLCLVLQAWCLANVVDGVAIAGEGLAHVWEWLAVIPLAVAARAWCTLHAERQAHRAALAVKSDLRQRLLAHLRGLGPSYLATENSGGLSTIVSDSIEGLEDYYSRYLPAMSTAALIPLSILVFVFPSDWRAGLVLLITAPLIPFFMVLIGRGAESLNQKHWQELERMGGHFLDVIQGLTTLKLFNASRREAEVIARLSDSYRQSTMRVLRVAFLSALALEFFATVSIALVAVTVGFRLLYNEMDFLSGFFVLLLAPEFYLPLRTMGTHYHARLSAVGAAEKIFDILDQPLAQKTETVSPRQITDDVTISFTSVAYAYTPETPVLRGIDLSIAPGERVAIVGPSGAGKSTVLQLLLGFVAPQSGSVRVGGVDMAEMDTASWYRRLAWIPQQPLLFHGSIRDNISLGVATPSAAALTAALRSAQAEEFIERLPNGLDTVIGDGGQGLSGGQIQRIALARAFLRQADVLVFDEATANLDTESERLIQAAVDAFSPGRTVITVAHRLTTVQHADRIVVLDQGRIVQQGRHSELIAQPGLYRELVHTQVATP